MIEELIISIKKSKFRFFLMAVLFTIVFFLQNFILFESENVQAASKSLQTVYDGKDYFYIGKNFDNEDTGIFYHSPDRLDDLKTFYRELTDQPFFEYYLQINQALELVEFEDIRILYPIIKKAQRIIVSTCLVRPIFGRKLITFQKALLKNLLYMSVPGGYLKRMISFTTIIMFL